MKSANVEGQNVTLEYRFAEKPIRSAVPDLSTLVEHVLLVGAQVITGYEPISREPIYSLADQ
jgi:hypothetical protein